MHKTLKIYSSHDEADRADRDYYASLTPEARVQVLLDLVAQHREATGNASEGLARVCRVVELGSENQGDLEKPAT